MEETKRKRRLEKEEEWRENLYLWRTFCILFELRRALRVEASEIRRNLCCKDK